MSAFLYLFEFRKSEEYKDKERPRNCENSGVFDALQQKKYSLALGELRCAACGLQTVLLKAGIQKALQHKELQNQK